MKYLWLFCLFYLIFIPNLRFPAYEHMVLEKIRKNVSTGSSYSAICSYLTVALLCGLTRLHKEESIKQVCPKLFVCSLSSKAAILSIEEVIATDRRLWDYMSSISMILQ